jgi:hypothetical protein
MEPLEPLESHVLFAGNDAAGTFEVGTIDPSDGQYVPTHKGTGFGPGWTHVVAVGPHVLSVRNDADGTFEVGHIDQSTGQYVQTESSTGFFAPSNHVVAVGPYVLSVRKNGWYEVGHIDQSSATYVPDHTGPSFGWGWTHVVAVGPHFLLVRNLPVLPAGTGGFAVRHIDQSTAAGYVETHSGTFSNHWTHVVAVGPHVLFVSAPTGQFEVGHIDESFATYVPTQKDTVFTDSNHVVAACSRVFLSRHDQFVVGHIDQSTVQFVKTDNPGPGVGGTPDPIYVVAVGPHVLGVSPTKELGYVMHFNHTGQVVETQSGPPFASDWAHVVAVA